MCGFFGFIPISSKKINKSNEKRFKSACNRINHRGFTSETVSHKGAHLYHTLLPLVNSQITTKQPFFYEESLTLFNGQIYNWRELYSKYKKYFFSKPNSDTEVIAVLLNKVGEKILNEFDGMFAISFIKFKPNKTQLLLARDRFGTKPLYYAQHKDGIIFSSEFKPFLDFIELNHENINVRFFDDINDFRYPIGNKTFLKSVLRCGHGKKVKINISNEIDTMSAESFVQHEQFDFNEKIDSKIIKNAVLESYERQQNIYKESAVFLSGGIDSSIIAACSSICGFKHNFYSADCYGINEFEYVDLLSKKYGFSINKIYQRDNLDEELTYHIKNMDEIIIDPACLPLKSLTSALEKKCNIVFSGEGADEMFGGYNYYYNNSPSIKENLKSFIDGSFYNLNNIDLDKFISLKRDDLPIFSDPFTLMEWDQNNWLPQNLMMKADKVLMTETKEGRFPFLSNKLLHLHKGLTIYDIRNDTYSSKSILKEAFSKELPDQIIFRNKMGFTTNLSKISKQLYKKANSIKSKSTLVEEYLLPKIDKEIVKSDHAKDIWSVWNYSVKLAYLLDLEGVFDGS